MLQNSINPKDLDQLKSSFYEGTRGMWACIGQDGKWGIFCNDKIIAENMTIEDAYVVDMMHAHFLPLVDEVGRLQKEKTELQMNEDNYKLRIDSLERQVQHWKNQWNAAIKAGEELGDERI